VRDPLDVGDPVERRKVIGIVALFTAGLLMMLAVRPSWINAVLIVLGLTLVIMLHEFGHYWTAKKSGMKVTEFFVGFGPRIWSFRKGETEYGIKGIPLGGYVRIIGMNNVEEVEPEDEARTYRAATLPKKLFVILAGVTVNFILAFICIALVFTFRGRLVETRAIIGTVAVDSPARAAGIQSGDRIVSINGEAVNGFAKLPEIIRQSGATPTTIVVLRKGVEQTLTVTPKVDSDGVTRIGVSPSESAYIYKGYGPVTALGKSFVWMGDAGSQMVTGIGKLVTPSFLKQYANTVTDGNASDPNRPKTVVGIAHDTNTAMGRDPWALIMMLAALNLFLGLFNLIPLLPFDGGHAVIAVYEGAASRVAKRKVVVDYNRLMPVAIGVFILLLLLAIPALVLDISQFF
jgi:membrane-associated protease RseP (regulator of RpoE activity)